MASGKHKSEAAKHAARHVINCAVLTVSDTRTTKTDTSGAAICKALEAADHTVVHRVIVADEPDDIALPLIDWIGDAAIHAIITTGGTGFAPRDRTIEVVSAFIDRPIEGFGELFRLLSHQQVGSAAMLSSAVGGLITRPADAGGDTFIFALPGSQKAVELAMDELIVPELAHLVWHRAT